jgi:hypothetical protein
MNAPLKAGHASTLRGEHAPERVREIFTSLSQFEFALQQLVLVLVPAKQGCAL